MSVYYKKGTHKSYVFNMLKQQMLKYTFGIFFYTLLVYTKNPFWVCNIKNVHNYDAHIKNMQITNLVPRVFSFFNMAAVLRRPWHIAI